MNLQDTLEPLIYFDQFDYPLTLAELWSWQKERVSHNELLSATAKLPCDQGLYFLPGRDDLVKTRQSRYLLAERKIKRRYWAINILAALPFIKMIALCNSLSFNNAKEESDIDLFIVTATGKLWLCRFLAIGFLKLSGLRPQAHNNQDKICLSFWVDENNLNLQRYQFDSNDFHYRYWLADFLPLYDGGGYWSEFVRKNKWLNEYFPQWSAKQSSPRREISLSRFEQYFKKIGELILARFFWEQRARSLQLKIFPKAIKEIMNQDSRVVVSSQILKFHTNDRRREYNAKFVAAKEKYANLSYVK